MKKKKVVTIGGGTGQFMLLSGLKNYPFDLTAIVSMADDGGSTGVLRDELGVLPPGDVRQCLIALSDSSPMLRNLMNYRFDNGGLSGHSFGNLMLSALEKITGDFDSAVAEATKILNVHHNVVPVVTQSAQLHIVLADGTILEGENSINHANVQQCVISNITITPEMPANPRAIECIADADIIVIGPGNLYCSILPNLVVNGIAQAIAQSSATVIYNPNLTNKKGHTENFTVDDYVDVIEYYIGAGRIDYITHNTKMPDKQLRAQYEQQEGSGSVVMLKSLQSRTYKIVQGDLISTQKFVYNPSDKLAHIRALIRHDANKLAQAISFVAEYGEKNVFEIT